MVWVGVVVVLVLALVAWWWWARYTRGLKMEEVSRHIEEFAGYSGRGGVLEIRHEGSPRMLQFALRDEAEGKRQLEFGLPDIPWSEHCFDQIVQAAESAGFRCSVEQGSKDAPVRRFLSVVYGGDSDDLGEGTREILAICSRAMDFRPHDTFKIRFRGVISDSAFQQVRTASQ
jgi:hypothetical protein